MSCGIWPADSAFRIKVYDIVHAKSVEIGILLLICINCIALGAIPPNMSQEKICGGGRGDEGTGDCYTWLDIATALDYIIAVVFTSEALGRTIASGFVMQPTAYLRNGWNRLDFICTVSALVELIPGASLGISGFRAFRILRALRAAKFFNGILIILESIRRSMALLSNIVLFMLFTFATMGLFSMAFFSGAFHNQCVVGGPSSKVLADPTSDVVCNLKDETGPFQCPTGESCGADVAGNPANGLIGFDSIWLATMTNFVAATLEGWTDVLYLIQDAGNPEAWIYFTVLVVFGSFLVLNLFVAVITSQFSAVKQDERDGLLADISENEFTAESPPGPVGLAFRNYKASYRSFIDPILEKFSTTFEREIGTANKIISHPYFDKFIMFMIVANTFVMASESHTMSDDFVATLKSLEVIFNVVFIGECVFKIIGMSGFFNYVSVTSNAFDFTIVVFSIISMSMTGVTNLSLLRVFRLCRVARVAKLMHEYPALRKLLNTAFSSTSALANTCAFILFCMISFALLGMQLYGNNLHPGDDGLPPRSNFNTFGDSMMTLFQVMTGENWNEVLYGCMNAPKGGWMGLPFVVGWFSMSNFLLLEFFVAVILDNFQIEDEEKMEMQMAQHAKERKGKLVQKLREIKAAHLDAVSVNSKLAAAEKERRKSLFASSPSKSAGDDGSDTEDVIPLLESGNSFKAWNALPSMPSQSTMDACDGELGASSVSRLLLLRPSFVTSRSLLVFGVNNPLRKLCQKISSNKYFDWVIIVFIIFSSICLAMENRKTKVELNDFFKATDMMFLVVFSIEFVIKVVANGFIFTPNSYLSDGWNWLDFVIVVISYIDATIGNQVSWARVLRIGRTLRPLRMVSRNEGMKVVISALGLSLPNMFNALLLSFAFFTIFAILGLNLFMGKFFRCNDDSVTWQSECVGTFVDESGQSAAREWANPTYSFDSFGESMLTLFEVSTLEGWLDVMYSAMDYVPGDPVKGGHQPVLNANPGAAFFFIIFIVVCSFFVTNLFVGVIVDSINQGEGSALLTDDQQEWLEMKRNMAMISMPSPCTPPEEPWRGRVFKVVTHPKFDRAIMALICFNTLVMCTDTYGQPGYWVTTVDVLNKVCVVLFVIEAFLKLSGLGAGRYFSDSWNKFDFILVGGSVVMWIVASATEGGGGAAFQVARVFRIGRLFRVMKSAPSLRLIFNTLVMTLPAMANISFLLFLCFFIFSVVGVELFGNIDYEANGLENISRHANFETFGQALLLLFRCSTGENWNAIMHDAAAGDGGKTTSLMYFMLFLLIGVFLFLNLYVGAVIGNFDSLCSVENSDAISVADLEHFKMVWLQLDTKQTGYLKLESVRPLIKLVGEPLGRSYVPKWYWKAIVQTLSKDVTKQGVSFQSVLSMLGQLRYGRGVLTYADGRDTAGQLQKNLETEAAWRVATVFKAIARWKRAIKMHKRAIPLSVELKLVRMSVPTHLTETSNHTEEEKFANVVSELEALRVMITSRMLGEAPSRAGESMDADDGSAGLGSAKSVKFSEQTDMV